MISIIETFRSDQLFEYEKRCSYFQNSNYDNRCNVNFQCHHWHKSAPSNWSVLQKSECQIHDETTEKAESSRSRSSWMSSDDKRKSTFWRTRLWGEQVADRISRIRKSWRKEVQECHSEKKSKEKTQTKNRDIDQAISTSRLRRIRKSRRQWWFQNEASLEDRERKICIEQGCTEKKSQRQGLAEWTRSQESGGVRR